MQAARERGFEGETEHAEGEPELVHPENAYVKSVNSTPKTEQAGATGAFLPKLSLLGHLRFRIEIEKVRKK